jgi:hypothetical protein
LLSLAVSFPLPLHTVAGDISCRRGYIAPTNEKKESEREKEKNQNQSTIFTRNVTVKQKSECILMN